MPVNGYRKKLLAIGRDIRQEDVTLMKFLMKGDIGEGVLENINTSLNLIETLERLNWIREDDFSYLVDLLRNCDRDDLASILEGDEKISAPKISNSVLIIDLVATHIAGDWKRLARFLGLKEAKDIEVIDEDGRGVVDKATRTINAWMKLINATHFNKFPWEYLKQALQQIPRYDIIREVERKFPDVVEPHAPPSPPDSPEPGRPAAIAQASSVVENSQYPTAATPPFNSFSPESRAQAITSDATFTESMDLTNTRGAQTVLLNNRGAPLDDFDDHIINS